MTDLTEMWTALEAHQPIADRKGYGEAWKRMCVERTEEAADAAAVAAIEADDAAVADLASAAAAAAATVIVANHWAKVAVEHITKANEEAAK